MPVLPNGGTVHPTARCDYDAFFMHHQSKLMYMHLYRGIIFFSFTFTFQALA